MDLEIAGETEKSTEPVEIPEPDYSDKGEDEIPQSPSCISSSGDDNVKLDSVEAREENNVPDDNQKDAPVTELDGELELKIPVPDYPEEAENDEPKVTATQIVSVASDDSYLASTGNDAELIAPKKLINPCLLSKEHKALRQELKINHRLGKNPTEKPELIKVLKDRQEKEKKKEMEEHLRSKRTSFDIRLEQQAQKISQAERLQHQELEQRQIEDEKPEFFKIHSKIIQPKSNS